MLFDTRQLRTLLLRQSMAAATHGKLCNFATKRADIGIEFVDVVQEKTMQRLPAIVPSRLRNDFIAQPQTGDYIRPWDLRQRLTKSLVQKRAVAIRFEIGARE